ncbi:MAG: hypothetical protein ACK51U_00880 [bacterium]
MAQKPCFSIANRILFHLQTISFSPCPLLPAPRSPHQPIANAVSDLILDSLGIDRCCGQS